MEVKTRHDVMHMYLNLGYITNTTDTVIVIKPVDKNIEATIARQVYKVSCISTKTQVGLHQICLV